MDDMDGEDGWRLVDGRWLRTRGAWDEAKDESIVGEPMRAPKGL